MAKRLIISTDFLESNLDISRGDKIALFLPVDNRSLKPSIRSVSTMIHQFRHNYNSIFSFLK